MTAEVDVGGWHIRSLPNESFLVCCRLLHLLYSAVTAHVHLYHVCWDQAFYYPFPQNFFVNVTFFVTFTDVREISRRNFLSSFSAVSAVVWCAFGF